MLTGRQDDDDGWMHNSGTGWCGEDVRPRTTLCGRPPPSRAEGGKLRGMPKKKYAPLCRGVVGDGAGCFFLLLMV
jgi:hypothetical protein